MARSSARDPVEKFRFVVTLFDDAANVFGNTNSSILNFSPNTAARTGFSEATLPRVFVAEILHRENIDGNRPIKLAGLARYEPVTLRRGSTKSSALYDWYRLVNDDAGTLNKYTEAIAGLGAVAYQEPRYRKEVMISSLDRAGNFVKHWLLVNAWPSGYEGGDGMSASVDGILVEELIISYESFLELTGNTIQEALRSAQRQAETGAGRQAAAGIIAGILGR